jgi:hypothetical protein
MGFSEKCAAGGCEIAETWTQINRAVSTGDSPMSLLFRAFGAAEERPHNL